MSTWESGRVRAKDGGARGVAARYSTAAGAAYVASWLKGKGFVATPAAYGPQAPMIARKGGWALEADIQVGRWVLIVDGELTALSDEEFRERYEYPAPSGPSMEWV